jgi:EAL domain-containing protein (putative c-di-GMP-specific phosphodiesterase class I)
LCRGFSRGELTLHYQPQFDLARRDLIGVEALLRWRHPEHGWIPPGLFVPLAERTGLIISLGEWVLRTACQQAAAWRTPDGRDLRVSVNLSPAQFRHPDLAGSIHAVLAAAHLPPRLLELEITEGILMRETSTNLDTLHRLRKLGVGIAMDDFGTGYSGLGYLRRFAFDAIKIDRSFVRDLGRSAKAAAVLYAAISLGRSLGIDCIAEGVETEEQLAVLEQAGCSAAQGYYFSVPVPAATISRMLRQPCQVQGDDAVDSLRQRSPL